ncbi:MAG: 4-hydroxy-tetrahydrodipicolinate reductase [Lachnospiraceae bacterium]|jgi:4-hydroxy-tetrahydrodipicolinate reductase|nr:4-hydroxy-tetrahydrodipicolinate reductase [Lachnospiraceae bacterium]
MTGIIIHGAMGAMGRAVAELAEKDEQVKIVAGIDRETGSGGAFPIYSSLEECDREADVVVDFSTAGAVDGLLKSCVKKGLPLVLCTTGLSEEQLAAVDEAAKRIPILRSGNMSLGINLLLRLVEEAAGVLLAADFDPEIVEMHHRRKLDAPSGTAIMLAEAVGRAVDGTYETCLDRHERRQSRPKKEIGIQSVRGGTIVGEHDVIFAGPDELIEIRHVAYSRAVFANGALQAAKALTKRGPGLCTMKDIIE